MQANIQTIRTRYADISVRDSGGCGYPLLLLHGSGSSRHVFVRQFESAELRHIRILALDLPGHGDSTDASLLEGYTLQGLAATIMEVLGKLSLTQVAVFGWSLGGHIAIELAAGNSPVSGLMLTGTPALPKGPLGMLRGFRPSWDLLLASKPEFTPRDLKRYLTMCYGEEDTHYQAHLQALLRSDGRLRQTVFKTMMRGDGADQRRVVEAADILIAIVNGEDDPVVRQSYLETVSLRSLWEGKCHRLPGTGHSPFWSKPDLFNPLLARFVDDVEAFQLSLNTPKAHRA